MKILFVGYNFYIGGIQRALINILHELSTDREIEIDLFLFANKGELSQEIPENANIIKSNYFLTLAATPFSEVLRNGSISEKLIRILLTVFVRLVGSKFFFKFLFSMQKKMGDYDVAISYFNDIPKGFFNRGSNQYVIESVVARKKIGWIHTDPIEAKFNRNKCLETYRKFDSIVNVSKAGKDKFDMFMPEYKHKSFVVYNTFPYSTINERANDYEPNYEKDIVNFVTVARIDNTSKRIDRIIEVVKMLKMSGYGNFKWWLVGDGPDWEKNRSLVEKYSLMDLIEFTGEKANPLPFVKHADAFVLASDFEGYPMVVGEALALGTPVITTSYASAAEQLEDGVNGLIVKTDTNALFHVLRMVLDDENILLTLKEQAKEKNMNNGLALRQLREILY